MPCNNCYWCKSGRPVICMSVQRTTARGNKYFETAADRWHSYGYILFNRQYGRLGSFIGGSLGKSAFVPNN